MDYIHEIIETAQDPARFIRLTFSGPARKIPREWERVVVSYVETRSGTKLQALFQGKSKEEARTIGPEGLENTLAEFFGMGFRHINLQCADGDMHVRITKKGKALVKRARPSVAGGGPPRPHNRRKEYPFPPDRSDAFLETIGVMKKGRVRASMRDKFRQINQFLMLLGHARILDEEPSAPIRVVDCGCGRAFLSLAAYHYLRHVRGFPVRMTGVDANPEVIAPAEEWRKKLAYDEVEFKVARIADYAPEEGPPDIVLSLHACDTATDEAIVQGVRWGCRLIFAAPCCQHELHHQLDRAEWRAALRHGILRERTADIVTDALRAAALRAVGYRTDVIEFIAPGHTAKNLMIRAEKARGMRTREALGEYQALRDFWNVRPAIEEMLDLD